MKTLLIPLDDRPVTFTFPALVAKVARVEAIFPPRQLMGGLTRPAQIEELFAFAENTIAREEPEAVIVSLDSLLYGGLITGRRSQDDVKTIMDRLERIKKWKTLTQKQLTIMAQSSIMRISDNHDNTEEKEYWARFGREIFEWSACLHRLSLGEKLSAGLLESLERRIPADIRQDYLNTRRRNFSVNLAMLKLMAPDTGGAATKSKNGPAARFLDYLIFSQDDSGAFGLNVSEKERLIATSEQLGVSNRVAIYAGADEVLMTLFGRLLIAEGKRISDRKTPEAFVHFSPPGCSSVASRYEGQDLAKTVTSNVDASGLRMRAGQDASTAPGGVPAAGTTANNSFTLIIHGPPEVQGDHITLPGMSDLSHLNTSRSVASTLEILERTTDPVILADVAYANGGDPKLVEELLKRRDLLAKIKSYGGWNTAGNTMGSVLAVAIAYWFSKLAAAAPAVTAGAPTGKNLPAREPSAEAHKQCLFVRLIDDWAYQACVRKTLAGDPSTQKLATNIGPYIAQVNGALDMEPNVRLCFPWKRTFEIEINFEGS